MNTQFTHFNSLLRSSKALIAITAACALLASCAGTLPKPEGAAEARSKLIRLQSDPNLASRAPLAIEEAEVAVRLAEQPQADKELAAHRVYIANRKIDTADARAQMRLAEDERVALGEQRERARLDARTREADAARSEVAKVRAESAEQKVVADRALAAAADAGEQAAELQRQIEALQAKPTDRGLVLTLGDVLFASGKADLKVGSTGNLNKLVAFLNKYPDRSAAIEGHTDSVGEDTYNQLLSQRRADSVMAYLAGQGVVSARLSAAGKGEGNPVADNETATGRQQNRRVEVVISTPAATAAR